MDVAVLYSGGKDSNYALYWALNQGWNVKKLVTFKPKQDDSFMFHVPCTDLAKLQAEAIGLPHAEAAVSGVKETEVVEMKNALSRLDMDGVVSGAIASEYQKTRIDSVCEDLGVASFAPLWHKNQAKMLSDIVSAGFEAIMVGVYADGFSRDWLGRKIDSNCIKDLMDLSKKHGINVAGEGGEYETLALDGPVFGKKLGIKKSRREWDGVRGRLVVEEAALSSKQAYKEHAL